MKKDTVTSQHQSSLDKQETTSVPFYHTSVLMAEVLDYLNLKPNGVYLDATFGGGGHTRAILESEKTCRVIALDWDPHAIEKNAAPLQAQYGERLEVTWGNFAHLHRIVKKLKIKSFDGILADFGTSQFQINQEAGFSFRVDTPLDMRMSHAHQKVRASDIINNASEAELIHILQEFGEEFLARRIVKAILQARSVQKITTTGQLAQLIENTVGYAPGMRKKIHPATKTFQALRIVVNHELENISAFLKNSVPLLKPQGRLVCISFHSLEDRIVKNFFKEQAHELHVITKKPVTATDAEVAQNRSSRSAKLRCAEKICCSSK